MRRILIFILLHLFIFLPSSPSKSAPDHIKVRPASVQTKRVPDTHLFVKTVPSGAKLLVGGKEIGKSPYLFKVPEGAKRIPVVVENRLAIQCVHFSSI